MPLVDFQGRRLRQLKTTLNRAPKLPPPRRPGPRGPRRQGEGEDHPFFVATLDEDLETDDREAGLTGVLEDYTFGGGMAPPNPLPTGVANRFQYSADAGQRVLVMEGDYPAWQPETPYGAGMVVYAVEPGSDPEVTRLYERTASGTSGAVFDSTEAADWTDDGLYTPTGWVLAGVFGGSAPAPSGGSTVVTLKLGSDVPARVGTTCGSVNDAQLMAIDADTYELSEVRTVTALNTAPVVFGRPQGLLIQDSSVYWQAYLLDAENDVYVLIAPTDLRTLAGYNDSNIQSVGKNVSATPEWQDDGACVQ